MRFEAIVANPPRLIGLSPLFMNDDRFSAYGKLPRVKLILHCLATWYTTTIEHGNCSPRRFVSWWCRRSHTPVFNKEKNYLDAVMGMPANIFLRNSIPTCMVMKQTDAKHFVY
jgi:type I restriction enzyme M protein